MSMTQRHSARASSRIFITWVMKTSNVYDIDMQHIFVIVGLVIITSISLCLVGL